MVGDNEGHTDTFPTGGVVVVPALDFVATKIEIPLLMLPQTIVMLVLGRSESRADPIEGCIRRTLVIQDGSIAVVVIRQGHRPTRHLQEDLALGRADRDVRAWRGERVVAEKLGILYLTLHGLVRRRVHDSNDQARGPIDFSLVALLVRPALGRPVSDEAVPRRRFGLVFEEAQADADDVRGIRLKHDGTAVSIQDDLRFPGTCAVGLRYYCCSQHDCQTDPPKEITRRTLFGGAPASDRSRSEYAG